MTPVVSVASATSEESGFLAFVASIDQPFDEPITFIVGTNGQTASGNIVTQS